MCLHALFEAHSQCERFPIENERIPIENVRVSIQNERIPTENVRVSIQNERISIEIRVSKSRRLRKNIFNPVSKKECLTWSWGYLIRI